MTSERTQMSFANWKNHDAAYTAEQVTDPKLIDSFQTVHVSNAPLRLSHEAFGSQDTCNRSRGNSVKVI